jgi:hypothetical protein
VGAGPPQMTRKMLIYISFADSHNLHYGISTFTEAVLTLTSGLPHIRLTYG